MTLATFLLYKGQLGGVVGLSGAHSLNVNWTEMIFMF